MGDIQGRPLLDGTASGPVMALVEPLSFWGGYDLATGRIIGRQPQKGEELAGRIVVMTSGRGSTSSPSVLAEAIRTGVAPAAIVLGEPDPLIVLGALVVRELYEIAMPVVALWPDAYDMIAGSRDADVLIGGRSASEPGGNASNLAFQPHDLVADAGVIPMISFRDTGDGKPQRFDLLAEAPVRQNRIGLLVIGTDDQPPVLRHVGVKKPFDEIGGPMRWDVLETGADEIEAAGWFPIDDVAQPDAVGPLREAFSGEVDQLGRNIKAVRNDHPAGGQCPALGGLHEVTVGAAHVEKCSPLIKRLGHDAPRLSPVFFIAAVARLGAGAVCADVSRGDGGIDLLIPLGLADAPVGQRGVCARQQFVSPVLGGVDVLLGHPPTVPRSTAFLLAVVLPRPTGAGPSGWAKGI